jgi:hypothetical protein
MAVKAAVRTISMVHSSQWSTFRTISGEGDKKQEGATLNR